MAPHRLRCMRWAISTIAVTDTPARSSDWLHDVARPLAVTVATSPPSLGATRPSIVAFQPSDRQKAGYPVTDAPAGPSRVSAVRRTAAERHFPPTARFGSLFRSPHNDPKPASRCLVQAPRQTEFSMVPLCRGRGLCGTLVRPIHSYVSLEAG